MKRWLPIASLFFAAALQAAQVGLIKIDGPIGPATANYITRALSVVAAQNDQCLIIQLDTPGGLLESTKQIVESLFASKTPTIVYVAPSGASAASAGVFITLAANVAAMAPNTTIGAAHPVEMGIGSDNEASTNDIMRQKLENYAASFMENIADKRHRNVAWAKSAVLQSKAIPSEKALSMNVIDLIATNLPDLLQKLNGRSVDSRVLHTAGARIVTIPMVLSEYLFQLFWQPEVMMLLMLVAVYGIIAEISHPGAIFPGIAGVIALILMLYMSATIPINVAGVILILLAVALFIIDLFTPTHGILTGGGVIAFFIGALMLFNHAPRPYHLPVIWAIAASFVTAAFFIFFVAKGVQAQFRPIRSGAETMIGRVVPAKSRIDSSGGAVFVEGEIWNAVSDAPVEPGRNVEITGIEGLTLKVKPKT
ncbi:MAG: nodulation protein NfeD [Verrucomicrobia bacterium]|nr:nodulation protein NfeD [Verrucomicrobiota bacterium]MDE3099179.1 nodulation protein NfeD [Verrucomicrobiota bacterium]